MYRIPYGISNFERIRNESYLYVDKTHFIKEIERTAHLLYLRPRRFGKSLFLSMLDSYYDVAKADQFDALFSGLSIYENPTKNKNNYYVLRFNFSGVENVTRDSLRTGFLAKVKNGIKLFIGRYGLNIKISESTTPADVLSAFISDFSLLNLPHKIYILIDEYDHFTNSILEGDGSAFLEVLTRGGFVRSFYEVIKEKSELGVIGRFFITGVMSITLDSMTSGFNIATNITTRKKYTTMMGFTAQEVKTVLGLTFSDFQDPAHILTFSTIEQETIFDVFRENYNGYLFSEDSDVKIFNSTLIMYYLSYYFDEQQPPRNLVDANLNQSSAIIAKIIGLKTPEENAKLVKNVVEHHEIEVVLEDFIDINKKFDQNDMITMLFHLGVLTLKPSDYGTFLEIPNTIIKRIYLQYLSELQQQQIGYRVDTREQAVALSEIGRTGKVDKLTAIVSEMLRHTSNQNARDIDEAHIKLSYFFLTYLASDFAPYDEFPAGKGYADLYIQRAMPSKARFEVFIEFKYLSKKNTTEAAVAKKLQEGIAQIEGYLMDKRLANRPDLKKYVIVFSGHEAICVHEISK